MGMQVAIVRIALQSNTVDLRYFLDRKGRQPTMRLRSAHYKAEFVLLMHHLGGFLIDLLVILDFQFTVTQNMLLTLLYFAHFSSVIFHLIHS